MKYTDFRDFPAWKKAYQIVMLIYKITANFPKEERFGITSDMRRSANSITHNLAEGYGRFEKRDKTRFYKISRASGTELQSQIMVSHGLRYIKDSAVRDEIFDSIGEIIIEINNLIKSIETRESK